MDKVEKVEYAIIKKALDEGWTIRKINNKLEMTMARDDISGKQMEKKYIEELIKECVSK